MKKNIYKMAMMVTVFSVLEKVFGFIYRIILSRTLGAEALGIYQTALSVFAVLLAVVSSGIPMTISRLTTKYRAENNINAQYSLLSAGLISGLAFAIPIFILLYFGQNWFSFLFTDERCMPIFLILLPSLIFNTIYSAVRGVFWGNKQFVSYCVIDLIEELALMIGGIILVSTASNVFLGAERIAYSVVIAYVLSCTLAVTWYLIKGGKLKSPAHQFGALLAPAIPLTGMRASNSILNMVIFLILPMRLIASHQSSSQAMQEIGVTLGMVLPILSIPATLIGAIALVLVPELSENFYKKEFKLLKENIEKAIKVTTLIACILIPPLFILGEDMGILLFGNQHSGEMIRNSCIILIPTSISMITTGILNSLGYEKKTCLYFFIGAIATLVCIWFLPQFFGIYSLIIGIALSAIISTILNFQLLAKTSQLKLIYFKFIFLTILTILPSILIGYILKICIAKSLPLYLSAFLIGGAILLCQGICCLLFKIIKLQWIQVFLHRKQKN